MFGFGGGVEDGLVGEDEGAGGGVVGFEVEGAG